MSKEFQALKDERARVMGLLGALDKDIARLRPRTMDDLFYAGLEYAMGQGMIPSERPDRALSDERILGWNRDEWGMVGKWYDAIHMGLPHGGKDPLVPLHAIRSAWLKHNIQP